MPVRADPDLLARFLALVSPHENYPPFDGGYFQLGLGERWSKAQVLDAWRRGLAGLRAGEGSPYLGLYLHWPFCVSHCRFCFCQVVVPKGSGDMARYLAWLKEEMADFSPVFRGARFDSVYFGGGTPSFTTDAMLEDLLRCVRENFDVAPGAHVNFESAPSTLTRRRLMLLRRFGLTRLSLGVQSLDPVVLREVDRKGQTPELVARCAAWVRDLPGVVLNMDLVCGLPRQTPESFLDDVEAVARLGPEMIHVFEYHPTRHTLLAQEGRDFGDEQRESARGLLRAAAQRLEEMGYRPPWRDEKHRVNFRLESWQNHATRTYNGSLLGFGEGVFSHVFGQCWYHQRSAGFRAIPFDGEEEMRGYILHHLETRRRLYRGRFRRFFGRDPLEVEPLAAVLRELEGRGVLRIRARWIDYPYKGVHPGRRVWQLKRFYSARTAELICGAHPQVYRRLLDRAESLGSEGLDELLAARSRRSYMARRFLKVSAAGRRP